MPKIFFVMSLLLLATQIFYAQDKVVNLLEISNQEQLDAAMESYNDFLSEAISEDEILRGLFEIAQLKCYFPCAEYAELIDEVKRHKLEGISPDVKYAASTVSKFLGYHLSVGQAQNLLKINDSATMFDTIGQSFY